MKNFLDESQKYNILCRAMFAMIVIRSKKPILTTIATIQVPVEKQENFSRVQFLTKVVIFTSIIPTSYVKNYSRLMRNNLSI